MTDPTMQEAAEILRELFAEFGDDPHRFTQERAALKLAIQVLGGEVEWQCRCADDEEWEHTDTGVLNSVFEDGDQVRRILILPPTETETGDTK